MEVKHEDDVQLVDNVAAASLFSPNMWVQRPQSRTPKPPPSAFKPPKTSNDQDSDGELQYLVSPGDDQEKQRAEEDMHTIAVYEQSVWQEEEAERGLCESLDELVAKSHHLNAQKNTILQLFNILGVQRTDFFNFHEESNNNVPEDQRPQKLIEIGQRLLHCIDGGAENEENHHQLQQQQQQQEQAQCRKRRAPEDDAINTEQQQRTKRQAATNNVLIYEALSDGDDIVDDLILDPTVAETPIDAPRPTRQARQQQNRNGPRLSPKDMPEEAKVAAALLTYTEGHKGAALLHLMENGYAYHMNERAVRNQAKDS